MSQQIAFQRFEGVAIFIAATILYFLFGFHWLIFILLLFAFDISMLGCLINNKVGAIMYNVGHSFVLPSIAAVLGVWTGSQLLIGLSLVWFAHIGLDRALGYGFKSSAGFKYTHLGKIGKDR